MFSFALIKFILKLFKLCLKSPFFLHRLISIPDSPMTASSMHYADKKMDFITQCHTFMKCLP